MQKFELAQGWPRMAPKAKGRKRKHGEGNLSMRAETAQIEDIIAQSGGDVEWERQQQGRVNGAEADVYVFGSAHGGVSVQLKACQLWKRSGSGSGSVYFGRHPPALLVDYATDYVLLSLQETRDGPWEHYVCSMVECAGEHARDTLAHDGALVAHDPVLDELLRRPSIQWKVSVFREKMGPYRVQNVAAKLEDEAKRRAELIH